MLRISSLLREAYSSCGPSPAAGTRHRRSGWVVIWNLTDHCNLACRHCYAGGNSSHSGEKGDGEGELSAWEAQAVIDDLARLDQIRVQYLGRKGVLTERQMPPVLVASINFFI